jgi:hypothetical protein
MVWLLCALISGMTSYDNSKQTKSRRICDFEFFTTLATITGRTLSLGAAVE